MAYYKIKHYPVVMQPDLGVAAPEGSVVIGIGIQDGCTGVFLRVEVDGAGNEVGTPGVVPLQGIEGWGTTTSGDITVNEFTRNEYRGTLTVNGRTWHAFVVPE